MTAFKFNNRTNSDFYSATARLVELKADVQLPALLSEEELDDLLLQRNQSENARMRATEPITDELPESTIEQRFAHVAQKLVAMWPSEACALYLEKLVIADRVGRQGFPPEVIDDLMLLHQMNEIRCRDNGLAAKRSEDVVKTSAYADVLKTAFNWRSLANNKHCAG